MNRILPPTLHESRFLVGIDLGTTNSSVCYMDTAGEEARVRLLSLPQLVAPGEIAERDALPSFCLLPAPGQFPPGALALPWNPAEKYAVGVFARDEGAGAPGRLVASAKSWLAHAGVDRTRGILPWDGDLGPEAVSPVQVSQWYLEHIRGAWNARFGKVRDAEGSPCLLEDQQVILTVPASFDETARRLTLEAATAAGLRHVVLLEEPLAAFYAWLSEHESDWERFFTVGETVLVVDVGGGTTDFSIIQIEAGPTLRRTAVGEHLLLGGDNMDMAIARRLEQAWRVKLSHREWSLLVHRCRTAKETLLSEKAPEQVRVGLSRAGGAVVGGLLSHTLARDAVRDALLEGFFPRFPVDAPLPPRRRAGLRTMGLPYADDPAVTRHLLAFLRSQSDSPDTIPGVSRVLFNGGALTPPLFRRRITEVLADWQQKAESIPELTGGDLRLGVARGAAYYGWVRRGHGVRVRGGAARAYYLEVGSEQHSRILCAMPRDTEENQPVALPRRFRLLTNRPVRFPLYASTTRLGDRPGDEIRDPQELSPLPPIHTVLAFGRKDRRVPLDVRVITVLTEVGTLDLWCETLDGRHRYPLSFDLRSQAPEAPPAAQAGAGRISRTIPESQRLEAARAIETAFTAGPDDLPGLVQRLETIMEMPRDQWGAPVLRFLADPLLEHPEWRNHTPEHESRWFNLIGFLLRPGLGYAADEWRIRRLWKLWRPGPLHPKKPAVILEWWICWRRVAPGLGRGRQAQLAAPLLAELLPGRGGRLGPARALEFAAPEMWRTLGGLEDLAPSRKITVLRRLAAQAPRLKPHHWWTVARLGARRPLFGDVDTVVPARQIAPVLPEFLHAAERRPTRPALFAVCSLFRLCGVRNLDVPEPERRKALALLERAGVPGEWRSMLCEVREESPEFRAETAGDSLPIGLVLAGD